MAKKKAPVIAHQGRQPSFSPRFPLASSLETSLPGPGTAPRTLDGPRPSQATQGALRKRLETAQRFQAYGTLLSRLNSLANCVRAGMSLAACAGPT